MAPILFRAGSFVIFNFSIFMILSWIAFSFIFWQKLKNNGVEDDKIFDMSFWSTIGAFVLSRLFYVILHLGIFADNLLKVLTVWVYPGFSLYGALIGIVISCIILVRKHRIRLSYAVDALGFALPVAIFVGTIGSLLDGTVIGKSAPLLWSVNYIGYPEARHPVQIYDLISLTIIYIILVIIEKQSTKRKWPYGLIGILFFLLFSVSQFALEFFKEIPIYWGGLTFTQWLQVAIASEAAGALYVKIGGKRKLTYGITAIKSGIGGFFKELYDKFPKRHT
jgi:phosphatidylglycerol:prolipoprotein diacylglycerol transferase